MIREDGALVSQAGGLHEARHVFGPRASTHMGEVVRTRNVNAIFGFRVVYRPSDRAPGLALFQTQYGWWDQISPTLVAQSVKDLGAYLRANFDVRVRLTYQNGLDLAPFKTLSAAVRSRIVAVKRTKGPSPLRGFAPVESDVWE